MIKGLPEPTNLKDAMERAQDHAPYLCMAMEVQPELTALLDGEDLKTAFAFVKEAGANAENVRQKLRREKRALALSLAVGDLAGQLSLTDVVTQLSDFADRSLDEALADIYATRYPDANLAGFAVIGLGKHGSRELNYSSDIDPIFIYDPEKFPRGDAKSRAMRPGGSASNWSMRSIQGTPMVMFFASTCGYGHRRKLVRWPCQLKLRSAIMNPVRLHGSRRHLSDLVSQLEMLILVAIFWKRSTRSFGGGHWTMGPFATSVRCLSKSVTIMQRGKSSDPVMI